MAADSTPPSLELLLADAAWLLGLTLHLLITTPIALHLCERGRSVLAAALFHGSGSGMVGAGMLVQGGRGPLVGVAAYGPALLVLAAVLFLGAARPKRRFTAGCRPRNLTGLCSRLSYM